MPPPQTKELQEKGQIVFVGKYKRSTEIAVDSNESAAQFTIYRPDGRPVDLKQPGRAFFDDLPPGTYTAVFKDVPGHVTPAPQSRTLAAGGRLSFYAEYVDGATGRGTGGGSGTSGGGGSGGEGRGTGTGAGDGSGAGGRVSGRGGKPPARPAPASREAELDRRVQMIVTSYPPPGSRRATTRFRTGVIIRKSDFQQGLVPGLPDPFGRASAARSGGRVERPERRTGPASSPDQGRRGVRFAPGTMIEYG